MGKRQRETVQGTVDSNPRCSPVTLTALPLPQPSSLGDIAFVCWGQQFSYTSTWASALLALRVCKSLRWTGISLQDRGEVKKRGEGDFCLLIISKRYYTWLIRNLVCMWAHRHRHVLGMCAVACMSPVWHVWTDLTPGIDSSCLLCFRLISRTLHMTIRTNLFQDVWHENNG